MVRWISCQGDGEEKRPLGWGKHLSLAWFRTATARGGNADQMAAAAVVAVAVVGELSAGECTLLPAPRWTSPRGTFPRFLHSQPLPQARPPE